MFLLKKTIQNYSFALFEIYLEAKKTKKLNQNLIVLNKLLNKNNELVLFLNSRYIDFEIKTEFIFKQLGLYFDFYVLNFLALLVSKNKAPYLAKIVQKTILLIQEKNHIQNIYVYSSILLSKKQLNTIAKKFSKKLNLKINIINKIDLNLLGGLKIKINDYVYDYSIKEQILNLKTKLLNLKLIN